jgi:hypothetical protein
VLEIAQLTANSAMADRLRHWVQFGMRLAFWPTLLLTLFALALALGIKQKEFVIAGPFQADTNPPQHSRYVYVPREGPARWWRQPMLGNLPGKPYQSFLQLRINDQKIGPPHRQHIDIRTGTTSGFSHWGAVVLFSLPPGVKDGPETIVTLHYSVRPRHWVTVTLAVFTALFGYLGYGRSLRSALAGLRIRASETVGHAERPIAVALRLPSLAMLGLGYAALATSIAYILASLCAAATGWALPATAPLRWSALAQWAARNEPYAGHLLVTLAGMGAIAAWLAELNPACRRAVERDELRLSRFLFRFGIVIIAFAFLLCISSMWAGIVRLGDLNFGNIGGLLPFSDAANYLSAAHDQAKDGVWGVVAARRPIAAAFRSVLLFFGNFSLQFMLILQICLVAYATWFAGQAVARWRGVWAAIAFVALTYIYSREFVPTTYTEALGLFWAMLSIPFFIAAIASGSVRPALVALAMTAFALMTRPGSMFTLPFMLVWLVWQFGHGARAKLGIFVVAICILIGIFGLNSLLQYAYGTPQASSSGNFAFVLCGFTMGTTWEGCLPKLAAQGQTSQQGEAAFARHLYAMAWENFRTAPGVFFGRLGEGVTEFVSEFPDVIWRGYGTAIVEPNWLFRSVLTAISVVGLIYIAARRAKAVELAFWALLWASIIASTAIVYLDSGQRTIAVSQPLIVLFFAIGLSGPARGRERAIPHARWTRYGSLGLIVATVLFICIPWIAHRLSPAATMTGYSLLVTKDEAVVFGGRRMSGFLVIEDGAPLRHDVPTLHRSDFAAIISQSSVESNQDLVHPVMPPVPFGFVFAPRGERDYGSGNQYIVPAEVVERSDVPAWHFKLKEWGRRPSGHNYWFYVTKAEPLHQ